MQASLCSGRVRDLRGIDRRGRAHVDHAERRHQHAGIGIGGRIGGRERVADVAAVVRIEQPVGEDVAQQALIEGWCVSMKPGRTMRLAGSMTAASPATATFGRTSRILPSSISTSAWAKSPTRRSRSRRRP